MARMKRMCADMKRFVDKVREIDPDAADYLSTDARRLTSYTGYYPPVSMSNLMIWSETPQGASFWDKIGRQLGEVA